MTAYDAMCFLTKLLNQIIIVTVSIYFFQSLTIFRADWFSAIITVNNT